jgi:hypothetical protein
MRLSKARRVLPRDTADIEGRQLNDADASAHVPHSTELVGARPGHDANSAAFREALYGEALGLYYTAPQQVVNVILAPDLDDTGQLYAELDVEAKVRGGFATQAATMSTAVGRPHMAAAEGRARLNLPS